MIVDQKLNKKFIGVILIDGDITGTKLAVTSKPNPFRKFMMKLLLGWSWISIDKLKKLEAKNKNK